MRKTYHILILLILHSSFLYAQENAISVSNFTVKNQLPPGVSEWGNTPGALLLVAQNNSWGDRPVKLLIAVKKGDNKICGIADGIALDYFKTGSFQTKDLLAALGNCEALPPGDYTLCARFRGMSNNRQWVDISTEVCKPFTVGGGSADAQKYQRPTLVAPANNKVFTEKEVNAPITLRCTPVVPKPQEPVIYHYRIWQVAVGQTLVQAMNGSQPVVEKEVENLTQTNITSGLFPCSPNCQFVWTVQATNREGKPYGENNGTSEASIFRVSVNERQDEGVSPNIYGRWNWGFEFNDDLDGCAPKGIVCIGGMVPFDKWKAWMNEARTASSNETMGKIEITLDGDNIVVNAIGEDSQVPKETIDKFLAKNLEHHTNGLPKEFVEKLFERINLKIPQEKILFKAADQTYEIVNTTKQGKPFQIIKVSEKTTIKADGKKYNLSLHVTSGKFEVNALPADKNLVKGSGENNNISNPQTRQDSNTDPGEWNDPNSCAYITPWYTGGNSNPLNLTAGTCTNQDFILKANNNKALWIKTNSNIGIGTEYPNRKFSVNGDVSIGLGYSNAGIGGNGIEILGGGQVPTRRGISTDADPNGHFDFFINGWQSANGIPEFRFKNGILNSGNVANSSLAPDLMKIDGLGRITINNFNATLTDKAFTIVNNTNPASPVDYFTVYGDGRTLIKSTNATPFKLWDGPGGTYNYEFRQSGGKLGMWALNNLFSYGLGIDNAAVGHIWADVNQNYKVINFKYSSGFSQVWIGDKQPIGTHSNYRLAVDGKLVAQSLYITAATPANWADYVFDDNYKLPNLYDIESYYIKNNHLPEIPSAKEVVEKGINVGEMNALLLKKIEELTILMVKQQKEIDELKTKHK